VVKYIPWPAPLYNPFNEFSEGLIYFLIRLHLSNNSYILLRAYQLPGIEDKHLLAYTIGLLRC